jgi:hypothetical protein
MRYDWPGASDSTVENPSGRFARRARIARVTAGGDSGPIVVKDDQAGLDQDGRADPIFSLLPTGAHHP